MANEKSTENNPASDDISHLLKRIAEKDTAALRELYSSHSGLLMGVILSVLKDKGEAEDVLQETFLTLWKKAEMYRPDLGKASSWMVTIAKNKAFDRYRKLVRKSTAYANIRENQLAQYTGKVEPEQVGKNEHIDRAMQEITEQQREAIELVFYQGFTQQEAAEKLAAPLGTVKARIRRGLLQLREHLNKG